MPPRQAREYYQKLLARTSENVDCEIPGALADTAKIWAFLAERLMFAVEMEGLSSLDQSLSDDYKSACLEEPIKFSHFGLVPPVQSSSSSETGDAEIREI